MFRCESGDLTGKHGQLSLMSDGEDRPFYTYVDSNLHLTGSFSGITIMLWVASFITSIITMHIVTGRSIGIHDISADSPLFDCGTIQRVYVSAQEVILQTSESNTVALRYDNVIATCHN